MAKTLNYYDHLLHIYESLNSLQLLPFEKRVKPLKKSIAYFKKNLTNEANEGIKEVLKVQRDLYLALSEAMHYESSYQLLYSAFANAKKQLKQNPSQFDGFNDLLEQIPCRFSEDAIIHLLNEDESTIDQIVSMCLAEHHAILHPKESDNH